MEITFRDITKQLGVSNEDAAAAGFAGATIGLIVTVALTVFGAISLQSAILVGAVFYFVRKVTLVEADRLEKFSFFGYPVFVATEEPEEIIRAPHFRRQAAQGWSNQESGLGRGRHHRNLRYNEE